MIYVDKSERLRMVAEGCLAEGVGFEPTLRFPVNTLSKRAPSATRPPLLGSETERISRRGFCVQPARRGRATGSGTFAPDHGYLGGSDEVTQEDVMGRGLLLWLLGIPLPIILLIWVLGGLHG